MAICFYTSTMRRSNCMLSFRSQRQHVSSPLFQRLTPLRCDREGRRPPQCSQEQKEDRVVAATIRN